MDVEYAIEEAIGYDGGSIDGLFDRLADLVGASEAAQPERDDEVFCTIRWSRTDILDAIENACGVRLDRDVDDPTEAEEIVNCVIDAVQKGLEERSTEFGWEVIDTLYAGRRSGPGARNLRQVGREGPHGRKERGQPLLSERRHRRPWEGWLEGSRERCRRPFLPFLSLPADRP